MKVDEVELVLFLQNLFQHNEMMRELVNAIGRQA
jgi:hypothetical protein